MHENLERYPQLNLEAMPAIIDGRLLTTPPPTFWAVVSLLAAFGGLAD